MPGLSLLLSKLYGRIFRQCSSLTSFLFLCFCCCASVCHPVIGHGSVDYIRIFYKYQIHQTCDYYGWRRAQQRSLYSAGTPDLSWGSFNSTSYLNGRFSLLFALAYARNCSCTCLFVCVSSPWSCYAVADRSQLKRNATCCFAAWVNRQNSPQYCTLSPFGAQYTVIFKAFLTFSGYKQIFTNKLLPHYLVPYSMFLSLSPINKGFNSLL